jgi:hypothetical protein
MPQLAGAGFGAAQGLEQVVAERLAQQRLAAQIQDQLEQRRLQEAALNQRVRESEDEGKRAQQSLDMQGQDRRAKSNQIGVRRMMQDAILQGDSPDPRALAALAVEAGDDPMPYLAKPKVVKQAVTVPGPDGKPMRKLVTEDELTAGVPEYREPKEPREGPRPDYEWVMRDGKPVQIQKGSARPGDTPYDATAQRNKPSDVPSEYQAERAQRTKDAVTSLKSKVSPWTTGAGSLLSHLPGTDATDFVAELDTLKASIVQNELAQMRAASKTGGALGQVSDRENQLLAAALGALDPRQSPKNFSEQLQKVYDSIDRWQTAHGIGNMNPAPSHGGAAAPAGKKPSADELILKYSKGTP